MKDDSPDACLSGSGSGAARSPGRCHVDRVLAGVWLVLAGVWTVAAGRDLAFHVTSRSWTSMWESAPLMVAMRVVRGQPVYADWHDGPVHLAIYGPLYYQALGWVGRWAGADEIGLVTIGRGWSIAWLAVGLAGVVWFVRRQGGPCWAGLIGIGCTGLFTPTALRFIASARPDMMAAALSLIGLTAALGRRRFSPLFGACLLSMAWLTKVTAVGGVLAAVTCLAWRREWQRLAWVAGGFIVVNAVVVAALWVATDGWFLKHLTAASDAPAGVRYVWFMLAHRPVEVQVRYLFVFPALALLTLLLPRLMPGARAPAPGRSASDARPALPATTGVREAAVFFGCSLLVALATACRQGSDRNYLIEPTLAAGAVMGTWAAHVAGLRDRRAWLWTRAAATLALISPMLMMLPDRFAESSERRRLEADLLSPYQEPALAWARSLPRPLLCLDSWLAYRAGVPNDLNDPIAYRSMVIAGGPDPIAARVRRGYYRCIVTLNRADEPGYSLYGDIASDWPALREAVLARYRPAERSVSSPPDGRWYEYVPIE